MNVSKSALKTSRYERGLVPGRTSRDGASGATCCIVPERRKTGLGFGV
jgi:hypothetical protein